MYMLEAEVVLSNKDEQSVTIKLFAESGREDSLQLIDESESMQNGEATVQLIEGCSYEYKLSCACALEDPFYKSKIVKQSRIDRSTGRIEPGIYVGTLTINVIDSSGEKKGKVSFEVRSIKASYREDYRFMLEDIAKHCTDLMMLHSSPTTQSLTYDFNNDARTLYQRFAFVKSILDSNEFNESVHRIITAPVTTWSSEEEETDIRRLKRLSGSHTKQIASRSNRIKLPAGHHLEHIIGTIPSSISAVRKTETVDNQENRFIKHVLEVFCSFCTEIRIRLSNKKSSYSRSCREALILEEQLSEILNHNFFKGISPLNTIPLNSPVLQRKEGYRELLKVWLLFDLAAKLIWKGGEDVYNAGKRDVAVLYEYWLFFKLLELLKEVFSIEADSIEKLIEPTLDGLGLKLKAGRHIPLKGVFRSHVRNLEVEFSYNRIFNGEKLYPNSGSWSKSMRPDYTLSVWPEGFPPEKAEEQELIVHIHFDAKYKVEGFTEIIGGDQVNHDKEKEEQRFGTYQRADLLKMHAYKDAIRRTGGAYVIYPGYDSGDLMRGFHEIIPGLGAFAVRPSQIDDGTEYLKVFIIKVVNHFLNRASQRDRMTYRIYDIHKDKNGFDVKELIPEYDDQKRALPPADIFVLIGYYKNETHYEWIKKNGIYNFRVNSVRGSIRLTPEAAGALYLILHTEGSLKSGDIWRIVEKGPRVFSKIEMIKKGYKNPSSNNYLVYKIEKCRYDDFGDALWDISELEGYKGGRSSGLPLAVPLADLMKVKIKDK